MSNRHPLKLPLHVYVTEPESGRQRDGRAGCSSSHEHHERMAERAS